MSDRSSPAPKKRKWHTKDQNGCTRCKARHVKCDTARPSCRNCVRRNEDCIYPSQQTSLPPQPDNGDTIEMSSVRGSFTALDIELFHRFITTDYPPMPADSTHLWTKIVPVYAHDHDFLMHALLAYSAASSTEDRRPGLRVSALNHRMAALRCIWSTMAVVGSKETSSKTRDSLLGAWYLLAYQCVCLRDGWTDLLPLVRGINLVVAAITLHGDDTAWGLDKVHAKKQYIREEWSEGRVERPPRRLLPGMMDSFRLLEIDRHKHDAQAFLDILIASATALDRDDTWKGYESLQSMWELLSDTDCVDFKALEDCSKPSTRVLMAHWLAMMLLLKPFYDLEVLLGRQGIVAQLPTWIFDISRISQRDSDNSEKVLQWPVGVASAYASQETGNDRLDGQNGT